MQLVERALTNCVVDQNIHRTQLLLDLPLNQRDRTRLNQISAHHQRFVPRVVFNVSRNLRQQIGAARRQYQFHTLLGQRFCNPHTDACAGTCDQSALTSQIQIHDKPSMKNPDTRSG